MKQKLGFLLRISVELLVFFLLFRSLSPTNQVLCSLLFSLVIEFLWQRVTAGQVKGEIEQMDFSSFVDKSK